MNYSVKDVDKADNDLELQTSLMNLTTYSGDVLAALYRKEWFRDKNTYCVYFIPQGEESLVLEPTQLYAPNGDMAMWYTFKHYHKESVAAINQVITTHYGVWENPDA